jgi:Spy/CpxP family protein refolding chaperone
MKMKDNSRIAALMMFMMLASLGAALAQEAPPKARDAIADQVFRPELLMRFQDEIGMDPDQKKRLREVVSKSQVSFVDLQWDLHDASQELADLLSETHPDESAVLEQLGRVLDAERKVKQEQIRLLVRIKNVLTAEQQAKLQELRPEGPPQPRRRRR